MEGSSLHVMSRGPRSTAFSLAVILNVSLCSDSPREGHLQCPLFSGVLSSTF